MNTIMLSTSTEGGIALRPPSSQSSQPGASDDVIAGRTPVGEQATVRISVQGPISYDHVRLVVSSEGFRTLSQGGQLTAPGHDAQSQQFLIDELRIGPTLVVDDCPASQFVPSASLGRVWVSLPREHSHRDEICLRLTNLGPDPASFFAHLDVSTGVDRREPRVAAPISGGLRLIDRAIEPPQTTR